MKILVVGATSDIAQKFIRIAALKNDELVLVGRNLTQLVAIKNDAAVRGAKAAHVEVSDLSKIGALDEMVRTAWRTHGAFDAVLIAHGQLGDHEQMLTNSKAMVDSLNINFLSAAEITAAAADEMVKQNSGCLAVITSVAGDRGRASNYIYGSAKAGLTAFVDGLAHRLAQTPVRALNIKLGMVATKMTAHLPPSKMMAKPEDVAEQIYSLVSSSSARGIYYVPGKWRLIMTIIKLIPQTIFWKTKL